VGAFDATLAYSEDWDLLIRLSFETPFRHVRGVTAAYRVFTGEAGHVEAGGDAFAAARLEILERYRGRRDDAMAVRVLDRISRRLWETGGREFRAEGELRFHRASHRRLSTERDALNGEARALAGDKARLEQEIRAGHEGWERHRDEWKRQESSLRGEIDRLGAIIAAMQGTKAWRLHLRIQKLKGKA